VSLLESWLRGELSPAQRVLSALMPAVLAFGYFFAGYAAFVIRGLVRGKQPTNELEARGQSVLMGRHLRDYFVWVTSPLWRLLVATGVSANTVTALAAAVGAGAGFSAALGKFALAGWLFLVSGILDAMDGRLARFRGRQTSAGEAFDSVLDRYVDFAMLAGLAWYYRDSWVLGFVLLALLGTSVVPYVRVKSEAMRAPVVGGLMQRPERLLYLGGPVAFSPILDALLFPMNRRPMHWLAVLGIVFLGIASNLTAIARFRSLIAALSRSDAGVTPIEDRRVPSEAREKAE
jgi:phosphatidylglycerophosphate synthase